MITIILKQAGADPILEIDNDSRIEFKLEESQVLIRNHASALNPIDWKTAQGGGLYSHMQSEAPVVLGWDAAGEVLQVGKEVKHLNVGDRVFGMVGFPLPGRTLASHVVAQAEHLAVLSSTVTYSEGAASGLAALTAYQALYTHGKLQQGMHVLIHAGAGGVGHFAIQMAHASGARVTTTCSAHSAAFVQSLGASKAIDYTMQDFETHCAPVDIVVDGVGYGYIEKSLRVLKPEGTLVTLPSVSSHLMEPLLKTYHSRGVHFRVSPSAAALNQIAKWLENKTIKPYIEKIYRPYQIHEAMKHLSTGHAKGKLVIDWEDQ